MGRAVLILDCQASRDKAKHWIDKAPVGTRVSFAGPQRTIAQNAKMWPCLTDISQQATLGGAKYTPDQWKKIFIDALGGEMVFLPRLESAGFFPAGHSSSELSKEEMADLITLILKWGDENDVIFSERPEA